MRLGQKLLIALAALLMPITPVLAQGDGDAAGELILYDGSQRVSGVTPVDDPEAAGNTVAYWRTAGSGARLPIVRDTNDLSSYEGLTFRFYSAKADGYGFMITIDSNPAGEQGNYYISEKIVIDWTGWKEITLPFHSFRPSRKPVGWQKAGPIMFANNGYGGMKPNPDAEYYIDDLRAVAKVPEANIRSTDGKAELSSISRQAEFRFPLEPGEEKIYGVKYEMKGTPGAGARIRQYRTWTDASRLRQKTDITGHRTRPLASDDWEPYKFEFLVKKGSAALDIAFTLDGDQPVSLRNVELVEGGFPDDPPLPQAPYVAWIDSLKPDLDSAAASPLLEFEDGGHDLWQYRERVVGIDESKRRKLEAELAPYLKLSAQELVDLMPTKRPFRFSGWGDLYGWSPEEPDRVFDKKAKRYIDVEAEFPIHGYEKVEAPSGKLVSYAYHDTAPDDPKWKGKRIYVEQFQTDAAMTTLFRAGYDMAGMYRLTGDPEYGVRAAAILWAMARNIPDWPVTGKPAWNSPPVEIRLQEPDYYEWNSFIMGGNWYVTSTGIMVWHARYFDLLRDQPVWSELSSRVPTASQPREETAEGLLHVAKMILKRDAYYRFSEFVFFHNLSGTANRSVIQLGRVLGVPGLVHYGLHKVEATFRRGFMVDGVFPESQWYTLDQFVRQSQALDALLHYSDPPKYACPWTGTRLDVDQPTDAIPTYDRVHAALYRQTYPDGTAHTAHDSWSQTANPPAPYMIQFPGRESVEPYLFQAYGHGILGRGKGAGNRIESHLHYSGYYNHGHRDLLNLILWAYGDELVSDIGYTHITQYHGSSLSHNLVVVDQSVQKDYQHTASLELWAGRLGASQAVQAQQGPAPVYPQCDLYRRSLIMLPFGDENAVLDIFEVRGGSRHDWMANGNADYEQIVRMSFEPDEVRDNLGLDGNPVTDPMPWGDGAKSKFTQETVGDRSVFYGAFRNAKIKTMTEPWTVTMSPGEPAGEDEAWAGDRAKSTAPKPSLRLHWMSPLDGKAIVAEAPRNRYRHELQHKPKASEVWAENRMPKIIVSREGDSLQSTFVALWEPFMEKAFLSQPVELPLNAGAGQAWSIASDEQTYRVLYRSPETSGALATDGLVADGRIAVQGMSDDVTTLDLYGGTRIESDDLAVSVRAPEPWPIVGMAEENGTHWITVRGEAPEAAQKPVSDEAGAFICLTQEGQPNRWLKLHHIEPGSKGQLRLALAAEPGFVYEPETGVLRETYFPHRVVTGQAAITLQSWVNVRKSAEAQGDIQLRASDAVRLRLKGQADAAGSVLVASAGEQDGWQKATTQREGDDLIVDVSVQNRSSQWTTVRLKP